MQLRELIFQGALGSDRPIRLRPEGSLARLELPEGVSARMVHDLVVACLYPDHLGDDQRERLKFDDSVKLAAVLETDDHVFRVIRRREADSVRLQRRSDDGYDVLVSGAVDVESALQQKLNLPELPVFFPLNLWRFDPEGLPAPRSDGRGDGDPQVPEVARQYHQALEVESVEDEIKELEQRIDEGRQALGEGRNVEEKLERARNKLDELAVDDISDDELEVLEQKDEKLDELDAELDRLRDQEHEELDKIDELLPDSPLRSPVMWAGLGVAVLALIVSFVLHDSLRVVALASIPGWAVACFAVFRYFHNTGQASLRKVRLQSIRRRMNQLREEQVEIRERVDHMLFHAGVEDENELRDRLPRARELTGVVEQLEDRLEEIRRDPEYRQAREELDELEERLEQLRERRSNLPDVVMNSFQLEHDLEELGADPSDIRETDPEEFDEVDEEDDRFESPFTWLRMVADRTDQWNDHGLADRTRSTWSKICGHVLSDRFDGVDLTSGGELEVEGLTDEQLEMWQNTRSSEVRAVVAALALSLHVNRCGEDDRAFSSVWIPEPSDTMTPGHAEQFESVFRSAAKKSQIVICGSDQ